MNLFNRRPSVELMLQLGKAAQDQALEHQKTRDLLASENGRRTSAEKALGKLEWEFMRCQAVFAQKQSITHMEYKKTVDGLKQRNSTLAGCVRDLKMMAEEKVRASRNPVY